MKFYDDTQPLCLETNVSGVGLGAALLQTRSGISCPRDKAPGNNILTPITFASKSLSGAEWRYTNIERDALGILHGLKKFCHYCFAREVSIITDHKPLVVIFKEDVATLSQKKLNSAQNTPIKSQNHIQTWTACVHHRLALQTEPHRKQKCRNTWHAIEYWHHTDNHKHTRLLTIRQLQQATSQDDYLQQLKEYNIRGLPENKDQIPQDIWTYWTFWDDMGVIDGIILKGRHVVIPESLKKQALDQLHLNHMGIDKTKLLTCESIYWININNDLEE